MTSTLPRSRLSDGREKTGLIDCDIHNAVAGENSLKPYLSSRWRSYLEMLGSRTYSPYANGYVYPKVSPAGGSRLDSWPPSGGPPGSDLDFMREQLLDAYGIEYGILNCLYRAAEQRNEEYGSALARAINEWQVEHWLDPEPRLRASITVAPESPDLAAKEIERASEHRGFVQVLLFPRTREPLGRRHYWPIYEAASSCGLPVGIHFASTTALPITAGGWPSYYIEDHTVMSMAFQAQVTSLILNGTFERFPELKIALVEGGFAWVPPLMWRLDALFHRLYEEVPYLTRPPSEYVSAHMRMTTQPMEEPDRPRQLIQLIEELGSESLMFSTDYPHWDFDNPRRAFQVALGSELEKQILHDNAQAFYQFEPA